MNLDTPLLSGRFFDLEPLTNAHKDEMAAIMDCDPERWQILLTSGAGEHFPAYWDAMVNSPRRLSFAARHKASGRIVGSSAFIDIEPVHRTVEIGGTWFHPEFRGTALNPEAKYLMLAHAFAAGALRCSFSVDSRNSHSQAAVTKLGATREGVIRHHRVTWTGHRRDSVIFSIIDAEWPRVKAGLETRLDAFRQAA